MAGRRIEGYRLLDVSFDIGGRDVRSTQRTEDRIGSVVGPCFRLRERGNCARDCPNQPIGVEKRREAYARSNYCCSLHVASEASQKRSCKAGSKTRHGAARHRHLVS